MASGEAAKPPITAKVRGVVSNGRINLLDEDQYRRELKRMKLGEGEVVIVRVEREVDAKRHHQLRWVYGYIYRQVSEHTGYAVPEVDAMFRALCMPKEVETLSLMTYDQMAQYIKDCEDYAASVIGVVIAGPEEARRDVA